MLFIGPHFQGRPSINVRKFDGASRRYFSLKDITTISWDATAEAQRRRSSFILSRGDATPISKRLPQMPCLERHEAKNARDTPLVRARDDYEQSPSTPAPMPRSPWPKSPRHGLARNAAERHRRAVITRAMPHAECGDSECRNSRRACLSIGHASALARQSTRVILTRQLPARCSRCSISARIYSYLFPKR